MLGQRRWATLWRAAGRVNHRNAGHLPALVSRETTMKTYLSFLALVGVFAFSILYLADRERKAGVERLSNYKSAP
jgi:hypothetical protein